MLLLPGIAGAQQRGDSVAVRKAAERAQVRFERIRKLNLPRRDSGPRGECDARIGRFCHWNSADDTVVAPEPASVRRAKQSLLATLDTLSQRSSRDGWITGQRIRYLIESGGDSTAVSVARGCRAERWWCEGLLGLTLHEAGQGAEADSAFARALAGMPERERCRWTDMTPLLDAAQKKRYGKVGCGENEEVAARLWWLADAFHSIFGNDRQAEHFSRHVMARILEPARIVYSVSWGNDIREMIVRYGWARYWTQRTGTSMEPYGGAISGHEATPNYRFIPVSLALDSLHDLDFDLDNARSAERYAPVAANRLTVISPQVALFRRGDSAHVVVAYDVSTAKPFDSAEIRSTLVLAADPQSAVTSASARSKGSLAASIDDRPHVLSLELISLDKRHAAWNRQGVWQPAMEPGSVEISDILLFEPGENHVTELEDAVSTALPGTAVRRGKTGFYWEIYGLAAADSALPVSLTLTPAGRSVIRRIGESIGLARRITPLNIAWRDSPAMGGVSSRSVVLDLSLVPPGKYVLRVEARPEGKPQVGSSRAIELQ